jgi:hypothetical protein
LFAVTEQSMEQFKEILQGEKYNNARALWILLPPILEDVDAIKAKNLLDLAYKYVNKSVNIVPVLSLLGTNKKEADKNILDQTRKEKNNQNSQTNFISPCLFYGIDRLNSYLTELLTKIKHPKIAIRDIIPPGYAPFWRIDKEPGDGTEYGYVQKERLAFIRNEQIDPVDIGYHRMVNSTLLDLAYFRDDRKSIRPTPGTKWNNWREKQMKHILDNILDSMNQILPLTEIYIEVNSPYKNLYAYSKWIKTELFFDNKPIKVDFFVNSEL